MFSRRFFVFAVFEEKPNAVIPREMATTLSPNHDTSSPSSGTCSVLVPGSSPRLSQRRQRAGLPRDSDSSLSPTSQTQSDKSGKVNEGLDLGETPCPASHLSSTQVSALWFHLRFQEFDGRFRESHDSLCFGVALSAVRHTKLHHVLVPAQNDKVHEFTTNTWLFLQEYPCKCVWQWRVLKGEWDRWYLWVQDFAIHFCPKTPIFSDTSLIKGMLCLNNSKPINH